MLRRLHISERFRQCNWQWVFPYIWSVNQLNDIKQILQQLKPELVEKYHVHTLGIFGSAVRDDFSSVSDVDIIVDFNQPIGIQFIDLADYIETQLQKKVDLVSRNGIKEKYFKAIEGEIVYV